MAKGQLHNQKMVKKPKKDTSGLPKTAGSPSDRPVAPMTAVIPRGKIAKER